jgi:glycosyltransferase involved in cell wall biosynthesis
MSGRRITVVASELLGRAGTGGAGTADSLLAVALGRHGHEVELLVASGREIGVLSPEWTDAYAAAHVSVRVLERLERVRPPYLAPALEVYRALRDRRPEVVIADEWRGLAYFALRARQTGIGFSDTAFVTHCHSPARVLAEFAGKVPDTLARFAEDVTERASIELADAVVSPSEWLLGWMRAHGWPVPESAAVIQYLRQGVALDELVARAPSADPIHRLAFFGQLREGKGIRIFLEALEQLDPIEVVFLGSESKRWTRAEIVRLHPEARVETGLTRESALAELMLPGTLAVMPSLLDNSPNTVSECIEHGVPFVATNTGGIPELVAAEDRERVLCRPTADDLAAALSRALSSSPPFAPARPARNAAESLAAWLDLVENVRPPGQRPVAAPRRVGIVTTGDQSATRARRLAASTRSLEASVAAARSRAEGLAQTDAEWIVFVDEDDEPDDGLLDTLAAAQAASGADVVTCGVRPGDDPDGIQLFLGDPGVLGLVENHYGVLGLIRRTFVDADELPEGVDPDWLLFARAALAGARIVSLPEAFATHAGRPGRVTDVPGEGLAVLAAFEANVSASADGLPQLTATLAAALAHSEPSNATPAPRRSAFVRLARRAAARLRRG